MLHPAWLPIVMQGSFSEIYAVDCKTLRFVEANHAAQSNLQYSMGELARMTPLDVAQNLNDELLEQVLHPLRSGDAERIEMRASMVRKDGTAYPMEFRLFYSGDGPQPVFIVIGNDVSDRQRATYSSPIADARFHAVVENTPGLVYQFLLRPDGSISFPYLSKGCHALLGVPPRKLRADPSLFLEMILPEDRHSYVESMAASAATLKDWNWEGRIWINKWRDVKWISLRSTARALPNDGVQWEGIMTNITESKLEQAEVRRSREQLAELSAHVETVKEKERMRIARELHDDLGGNLTAIKMALALLTRRLPAEQPGLQEKAGYVNALVDRTIEAVHRISADLRPGMLDLGIVAAIEWQAKEFEKRLGVPCEFSCARKEIDLHPDQATALFRIFQETLTNISKHAEATRVIVTLECAGDRIRLEVVDNGKGIAAADRIKPGSFGILGMTERARALGGLLEVTSEPGAGSVVLLEIPLKTAGPTYETTYDCN